MSPRNIFVTVALTAAALGSWYLARQVESDDTSNTAVESPHRGYYLKSARILGTGPDGGLLYEIQAKHAEQRGGDEIVFTDVLINYSPASDVPWIVNADSALLNQGEQRVRLSGHVRALSSEGFSGNDTEIRTPYLELDPVSYIAETDQRVQIRIGARSLTATGMLASLQENRLELKSNVNGKFAP
ncbi:MAG: LPS export ABC transporter periplasmic protein LptC [Proteobacteria bacterium]|nr:LPS export ABC transporter periplasmic protein LptC [Pseudomonadota bacterium]MDA1063040.1 LPS export ABC transporter periplasmic protein LptC [Pseudomonadota bacterium]